MSNGADCLSNKDEKKVHFLVVLLVFLLSFLWFYSLTYNFNFFWEDTWIFGAYDTSLKSPELYSGIAFTKTFLHAITDTEHFYRINYYARPLGEFYISVLGSTLGLNVLSQRVAKVILASLLMVVVYFFCSLIGRKDSKIQILLGCKFSCFNECILFSFLFLFYLLLLPELWILTLYLVDSLIFTILIETLALFLFFFYYLDDNLKSKWKISLLFFCIVFLTHIATLIRHIGRINFLIFFFFLLFTDVKKLFSWRYGTLISILFLVSFPIFGFFDADQGQDTLGITEHTGKSGLLGKITLVLGFLKDIYLAFLPHGLFLFLLLGIAILAHVYGCFRLKPIEDDLYLINVKKLAMFSLLWFLLAVGTFYIARGLAFDPLSFLRCEFVIFIIPQTLFILSYAKYVSQRYFSKKRVMNYIILLFLFLAILSNIQRLNEWRGGWGGYFLGYDTARQYMDKHAIDALLIVPFDHAIAAYFTPPSTNQEIMVSDFRNSSLLQSYKENYTSVFIAAHYPLTFDDPTILNIENLTIQDNSPYGQLKKLLRKYYATPIYLYEVKEANKG